MKAIYTCSVFVSPFSVVLVVFSCLNYVGLVEIPTAYHEMYLSILIYIYIYIFYIIYVYYIIYIYYIYILYIYIIYIYIILYIHICYINIWLNYSCVSISCCLYPHAKTMVNSTGCRVYQPAIFGAAAEPGPQSASEGVSSSSSWPNSLDWFKGKSTGNHGFPH